MLNFGGGGTSHYSCLEIMSFSPEKFLHLGRVALLDDPGNERELEYVFCWGALVAIFSGFRLHLNK